MEPQHDDGVALSAFDPPTATAVVTVLRDAGLTAWQVGDGPEEVQVLVPDGQRELALRELGARMEEVRAVMQTTGGAAQPPVRPADVRPAEHAAPAVHHSSPLPDPDDVHAGPPLVMERFRSMRILAAVVMAPLLVVTLAPTLRGSTARIILIALMIVAAVVVVVVRRRR